ncbi:MAG: o-succinylbenzoate synthase [Oscillatoriales cyanobacterium]|uniref:o-succinylbenzoate synthase n=1 Tax=Microcoleus anatoxicus PTRS2 TaxID=2705321 RepID=A0ABU8YPG8_9CYAN|nr:MAG: o-succinylbenzoate synthase [Oscillatoriales cyanobacterium]TAD98832.1 MAG: o-succinylbenzoate synthase [Oscillatoriales cyanobacterium]TAE06849.1 MAG: o-succinylbenzoate synthase [Oscillatoriales cyanobacterium]TAF05042.1 MAG: o-succinylbenzoate synthase [Oscillatoriales cyanobacterium]TAF37222.1 MAG: o-succinylbenzoate synthase [Oscillatoriales cyanobacterium]
MLYQFQFRTYHRKFKRPLHTSHGIWDMRSGIILKLTDEKGQIGWGEIAPLSWFGSESFDQALDFCTSLPTNISEETIFTISAELPACQFGFESALSNSFSGSASILNEAENSRYSGLLPAGKTALSALQTLWQQGFRTFKWKIGVAAIDEELQVFQQLIEAMDDLGDRAPALLRLDANGGLNYSQAETWLNTGDNLLKNPDLSVIIEFLEQPLPVSQFDKMLSLSAVYKTAIALDESVANLDRIQECYERGWRGIFVIKPAILGSPSQLRKFCEIHPIDAVFSSVFETQIGRQAALNLALELFPNSRALGFGTDDWFDDKYHSILDF